MSEELPPQGTCPETGPSAVIPYSHHELINALRLQDPHDVDACINLMGAAARALEDDRELHKALRRVLDWCSAYIGRAMSVGAFDGCVVHGSKALEVIDGMKSKL